MTEIIALLQEAVNQQAKGVHILDVNVGLPGIDEAKMLTDSGMTVDALIKQVSSPGGTTIAGLDKLYEGKLTEAVEECCKACTARAYELAENK